jgi:hypothetical protein
MTDNATHVCIVRLNKHKPDDTPQYCNARIKLTKGKPGGNGQASWLTTVAIAHLRDEHPIESDVGKKYADALQDRASEIVSQQMEYMYGMMGADGKSMVRTETFRLNKREKSPSAQAHWFVYSSMQISKSEFDSVWFQEHAERGRRRGQDRDRDEGDVEPLHRRRVPVNSRSSWSS